MPVLPSGPQPSGLSLETFEAKFFILTIFFRNQCLLPSELWIRFVWRERGGEGGGGRQREREADKREREREREADKEREREGWGGG